MNSKSYLIPEWPAPSQIKAFSTTRLGGSSQSSFASFNLGDHVHDAHEAVTQNREKLKADLKLKTLPSFLQQVHGTRAINLVNTKDWTADAAFTQQIDQVCVVMTADCLPLLVTNQAGTEVAAIHAGWRGLLEGVIEETLKQLQSSPDELLVWLGPAIGPCHFAIGEEIRRAFMQTNPLYENAFSFREQKLYADLYQLARNKLHSLGVKRIYGANHCTYCEAELFYSHRRDQGQTGRQASLIWMESIGQKCANITSQFK